MTDTNNSGFWNCICHYFGKKETVRETIEDLLEEAESNTEEPSNFSQQEKLLLNNVLYLKDKRCNQVMTPRAEIIGFQKDGTVEDLCQLMIEKGHSRIPIYDESLDDIVGTAHITDVAKYLIKGNKKAKAEMLVSHKVKFVSPSMHVLDLLSYMQKNKIHIALVIDEYGGVDGLITIEDLLEEIVGDIEDEYDIEREPEITKQSQNVLIADANAELDEIEEKCGWNLRQYLDEDDDEIDTVGGLVITIAERLPHRGEVIEGPKGVRFRILDVDSRRIKRVMIVKKDDTTNQKNLADNNQ